MQQSAQHRNSVAETNLNTKTGPPPFAAGGNASTAVTATPPSHMQGAGQGAASILPTHRGSTGQFGVPSASSGYGLATKSLWNQRRQPQMFSVLGLTLIVIDIAGILMMLIGGFSLINPVPAVLAAVFAVLSLMAGSFSSDAIPFSAVAGVHLITCVLAFTLFSLTAYMLLTVGTLFIFFVHTLLMLYYLIATELTASAQLHQLQMMVHQVGAPPGASFPMSTPTGGTLFGLSAPIKLLMTLMEAPSVLTRFNKADATSGGDFAGANGGRRKMSAAASRAGRPPVLSVLDPKLGDFDAAAMQQGQTQTQVAAAAAAAAATESGIAKSRKQSLSKTGAVQNNTASAAALSAALFSSSNTSQKKNLKNNENDDDDSDNDNDDDGATAGGRGLKKSLRSAARASSAGLSAGLGAGTIRKNSSPNATAGAGGNTVQFAPGFRDSAALPSNPAGDRPKVSSPASPATTEVKGREYKQVIKAMYSYVADPSDPMELSFEAGDILRASDVSGPRWWNAKTADGKTGIVPSNYMEVL